MPIDSFIVNWSMTNPIEPKSSHQWDKIEFEEHMLDKRNGWPVGTVSAMKEALNLNLHRKCEWQYKYSPALAKASTFFKRGVYSKNNPTEFIKGSYAVTFEDDEINIIKAINNYDSLILDYKFYNCWKHIFQTAKIPIGIFELSETKKNLVSFTKISEFIRTTKSRHLGIFGGGVLCDTAAFAAAENKIKFDLIPTTTLSMVDACIGGKCGVNFFPYGKNLVGLFAFPSEVIIHKKFLNSLRNREFKAGIYEGLKHCILSGDKELFKKLLESIKNNKIDSESLKKVIKVKSDVIEKDANENSVRATLNLGHTFAHAIEAYANKCNRDIMHGEAVLYGLVFAIQLSKLHLKLDSFDLENELLQLTKDYELASINRFISELTMDQVYPAILNDKKNEKKADTTQWILLEDWACVLKDNNSYLSSIDRKLIEDCLALFKKSLI